MKFKATTQRTISVYVSFFLLLLLCAVSMINCKRDRLAEPAAIKKREDENIAALLKMVSENKKSYYLPLNQEVEIMWVDKNGNKIIRNIGTTTESTAQAICDDPNGFKGENPSRLDGVRNTQATCGNGAHTLEAEWTIYTPLELLATSVKGSKSYGKIRVRNGSSTVWTSPNAFITTPDLVFIGMDPTDATIRMYKLKYTVPNVPHMYFQSGNATSVQFDFKVFSDCDNEASEVSANWAPGFAPYSIENAPCQRIDVCTIMPYTGNGSSTPPYNSLCGMIAGTDPYYQCPAAPTFYINLGTEVWVRRNSLNANFQPLETYASGLSDYRGPSSSSYGYIYNWEARFMKELNYINSGSPFADTAVFKWRNIHGTMNGNTPTITCRGAWSNEIKLPIKDF